jgi:hypothetical protein
MSIPKPKPGNSSVAAPRSGVPALAVLLALITLFCVAIAATGSLVS